MPARERRPGPAGASSTTPRSPTSSRSRPESPERWRRALGVALADSVRDELASRPTGSLAAYDAFLQGEAASQSMIAQDAPTVRRAMAYLPAGRGARFGVRARLGPALPGARDVVLGRQSDRGRRPAALRRGGAGPGARAESPRGVCRAVQLLPARVAGLTSARSRPARPGFGWPPATSICSAQPASPSSRWAAGKPRWCDSNAPRRSIHARPTRRDVSGTRS